MNKMLATFTTALFVVMVSFNSFAANSSQNSKADTSAKTQETAKYITFQELPSKVQDAVKKVCPQNEITNIEKMNYNGKTAYEVKCKNQGKTEYYIFSENGDLIKKSSSDISEEPKK